MSKISKWLINLITLTFIRPLSFLFYSKEYLGGKYFQTLHSRGWLWVIRGFFQQKLCGYNREARWPISKHITVICPENIIFDKDDLNNFQGFGNYYQAIGKISIGKGTWIAPNVGIITANHDVYDLDIHQDAKPVIIGERCWIGMNSVLLPGVSLGPQTIVGAGSIVTKSFPNGYCVIAGNPARKIRELNHNIVKKSVLVDADSDYKRSSLSPSKNKTE